MSDPAKAPPAESPAAGGPAGGAPAPVVIGLGELLWDEFPDDEGGTVRHPGGAPANVAVQCHQLGLTGRVLSRVGDDPAGRQLTDHLAARGLPTDAVQTDPALPTGRVSVTHGAGGPEYQIRQPAAWDALEATPAAHAAVAAAAAVCFGSLAQRDLRARTAIRDLVSSRPQTVLAVFDVNLRQDFFTAEALRDSLKRTNVLKLNDAEVPVVARLLELPVGRHDFLTSAADRYRLRAACVTRGPDGCAVWTDGDGVTDVPGEPVTVADTVGAGDAFTAGFLFALLRGATAEPAGRFANAVGGLVASRDGAMPELRAEYAALKERHGFA